MLPDWFFARRGAGIVLLPSGQETARQVVVLEFNEFLKRIASGAKRAPARQLVAVSNGTPTTAARTSPPTSQRPAAFAAEGSSRARASARTAWGTPANVRTPV